MEAVLEQNL